MSTLVAGSHQRALALDCPQSPLGQGRRALQTHKYLDIVLTVSTICSFAETNLRMGPEPMIVAWLL